jgi:hypothetical protein
VNPSNADVPASAAEAAIQSALTTWSTQSGSSFRYQYAGRVNDTSTSNDGRNVVIFRNAENGGAIASTYSWWSGGSRVDSDVIFWDADWQFFTGSSGCASGAYIEDVATHELGHSLGLGHSSVTEATMYPTYNRCTTTMRSPSADDLAGLKLLYPSTGSSTNTAPTVTIASPASSTSVSQGTTVAFSGSASDTQDGNLTASLVWTSNLDGQIGTGGSFSRALSAGNHTVTARAVDNGGLSATRQVSVSVTTSNSAPTVTITAPASGASVTQGAAFSFSGSATDSQDGTITSSLVWTSNLDGQIGTGGSFSRALTAGNHTLTARVVDSGGLAATRQVSVSVTQNVSSGITLSGRGYKVKGSQMADLTWTGTSSSVRILRGGTQIASGQNKGRYTDSIQAKGGGSYRYKVCDESTGACSNELTVSF